MQPCVGGTGLFLCSSLIHPSLSLLLFSPFALSMSPIASVPSTLPFSAILFPPLLLSPSPSPLSLPPHLLSLSPLSSPPSGERDVKRVLLLIRNEDDRERWLRQLSRITLSREDPAQKPPSPL